MNQEDSVSKVVESKSEEDLTKLLEKFEKNIIGSITRGIEIADNFSRESDSSQDQDSTKVDKTEAVAAKIIPKFLSADFEKQRWEFLNPIILYKDNWMGARTEGIYLDKGTYKIKYNLTTIASKGTGLAVFNEDTKKVEKLLSWQIGVSGSGSIINVGATQYLALYSPGVINITDEEGNFNPRDGKSIYIVTVFRLNTLPD